MNNNTLERFNKLDMDSVTRDIPTLFIFSGAQNFANDIEVATGRRVSLWWVICWKAVTPLMVLVSCITYYLEISRYFFYRGNTHHQFSRINDATRLTNQNSRKRSGQVQPVLSAGKHATSTKGGKIGNRAGKLKMQNRRQARANLWWRNALHEIFTWVLVDTREKMLFWLLKAQLSLYNIFEVIYWPMINKWRNMNTDINHPRKTIL